MSYAIARAEVRDEWNTAPNRMSRACMTPEMRLPCKAFFFYAWGAGRAHDSDNFGTLNSKLTQRLMKHFTI
jgi:hypothetical protein